MKRPRGSFGWLVALATWVVAASAYQALGPTWRLPMRDPSMLLALLLLSAAAGWAVQRGVRRTVGKTIFSDQATGWQVRLAFIRSVAQESNVLLGMLLVMALLGVATLWLAGRSVERIVSGCQANLQAQVDVPETVPLAALVGKPICGCLAQTFLDRNGVVRLALFNTPLMEVSSFKQLTPADERRCLEQMDMLPDEAPRGPSTLTPQEPEGDSVR
ncbi:hypothetical protein HU764_014760 [Pseudomonas sp. SWRI100]|nr:hypothetical protein [Pseudomonas sp. SWRI50]MBC3499406.1 hypothetical protein [Pseudomonas sp. SWRI67]MBV4527360.1 hypothetical protein [Pseudomonas kermanshahensis]